MILFFDTETDGLVHRELPHDHAFQPNLLQLGAILFDEAGRTRGQFEVIVASVGHVPPAAVAVHGIDGAAALRWGVAPQTACAMFSNLLRKASRVAAYRLDFDERVMAAAFSRIGRALELPLERTCVAEEACARFRIPPTARMIAAGYGDRPKMPSLSEAYKLAFAETFDGAHSALADCRAAARLHFHMTAGGGRAPIAKRLWRSLWRS